MGRKTIDCRDFPAGGVKCSVSISADNGEELVEAVVQHGTKVHGYKDTPEFRAQILKDAKEV
jgi:predicted small metal-binding protein